jgi:hypothetical protein
MGILKKVGSAFISFKKKKLVPYEIDTSNNLIWSKII